MSDNISLSNSNYEDFVSLSNSNYEDFEDEQLVNETMLAKVDIDGQDTDIRIWVMPASHSQNYFVMIGNVTISMTENMLLSLTKATQIAAKKVLNIN